MTDVLVSYAPRLEPLPVVPVRDADLAWAGVPDAYHRVDLDAPLAYIAATRECIASLPKLAAEGRWLVFAGPHGSGKTSAACAVLKAAMERRGRVLYYPATQVAHAQTWRSATLLDAPAWDVLTRRQVVLLDDVGVEPDESKANAAIVALLAERYHHRRGRLTLLTTNLSLDSLCERYVRLATHLRQVVVTISVNETQWRTST